MTNKNPKIVFPAVRLFEVACLLAMIGILVGCTGAGVLKASLGQEVSLAIGQTAQLENEPLTVRFDAIAEDSRCPINGECFWEGEVSCNVTAIHQGSPSALTLTQRGLTRGPAETTYQAYRLIYNVEPYPKAGKHISTEDYRLNLTVEK